MIIALSGKKQHGKDTAFKQAQILCKRKGITLIRIAFADPLKDEVFNYIFKPLGLSRDLFDNPQYKEGIRPIWIWWGNFIRRRLTSPEYWIDELDKRIIEILREFPDAIIVVTDPRFKNEAIFLQTKWNAKIIRVVKPQGFWTWLKSWWKSLGTTEDISETDLDDFKFDHIIKNDSTPYALGKKLADYIESL